MLKRKSHLKSRNGCQPCKKRHLKCDEQRPSCANCLIRKIDCGYQTSPECSGDNASPLPSSPKVTTRSSSKGISRRSNKRYRLIPSNEPIKDVLPAVFPIPSPLSFSSTPEAHRLLELQLMHRWSTRTCNGCTCSTEDQAYMQTSFMHHALNHSYLMNGLLALAALDLALSSPSSALSQNYLCSALEYSNRTSAEYRLQLGDVNSQNIQLLYLGGIALSAIHLAMPSKELRALERIIVFFDIVLGAYAIACTNIQWFISGEYPVMQIINYVLRDTASLDLIDPETTAALDRLTLIGERIYVPLPKSPIFGGEEGAVLSSEVPCYGIAIAQLKTSFAEDVRAVMKGFWMSAFTAAGSDFAMYVRSREPMALFILMHIAVLMDRSRRDPTLWWAQSVGKNLVGEISEILQDSQIWLMNEGNESIRWAREQVGLPGLDFSTLAHDC
ncbi:hypothetical protein B0O99DRAFT_683171 [Bisporella sp. PMI_857]|nr:hypothetical protein B0O99DRAFT_683171 [Bisporella sp. PMI_857]